jgi:hypothetical protein
MARSDRGGRNDASRAGEIRGPLRGADIPTPGACPPVPPGVRVEHLIRDPATGALRLSEPPRMLSFANIDVIGRAHQVMHALRCAEHRWRSDMARRAEPQDAGYRGPGTERHWPWGTVAAADGGRGARSGRTNVLRSRPRIGWRERLAIGAVLLAWVMIIGVGIALMLWSFAMAQSHRITRSQSLGRLGSAARPASAAERAGAGFMGRPGEGLGARRNTRPPARGGSIPPPPMQRPPALRFVRLRAHAGLSLQPGMGLI